MLALTLALLPILPSADELTRRGEHFQLVCHFPDEKAADRALAAVEAVWPRAAELYGLRSDDELGLLTVHLYRDAAAYEHAEEGLTGGKFKRNLAFAHIETMSAHVALQPPLSDEALDALGVPAQTLRLLAHEAAHLVRYTSMPNCRSHPGWLADGAASWIDEKVSIDLGLIDRLEDDPNFSSNLLRVQQLLEKGKLPEAEEILLDQTDQLEFFERYDARWLFFRFMLEGKNGKKFKKVLTEARKLGGGADFTAKLFKKCLRSFNKQKLASIDRSLRKQVGALEPGWDEVYRSLWFSDGTWRQAAFGSKNAIAWRRTPAGSKKYSVAGELTILPGRARQMNLLLGRSDQGFLSVAFTAGDGITLFEYLSKTNEWQRRGYVECAEVGSAEPFRFSATVEKNTVRIQVNGVVVVSGEMQTIPLDGPWGLGAQASSAGIWKLERAPGL